MPSPGYDADVIIAGAGMAGSTLALALASGGLRPLLVDPQPFEAQLAPTFDGRSSAIAYSSFRQWRTIGAGEALAPHAQRIEQILVTDGRTPSAAARRPSAAFLRFDSSEISGRIDGEPLGYLIENRQIRAALSQAVIAKGIPVIAPMAAKALTVEAGVAKLTLSDGRVLSAPLAVSAEGRGSVLRRAAGIGEIGWGYGQSGVVCTVRMQRPHEGVAHEYFLPSGPFAILPLTDNRASLVWTESTARGEALRNASKEAFHAHLMRRFGDFLGEVTIKGPTFVYPLSLSLAERMVAPRLALIGDAAHGVHPIAGQGLNLGLKDAAALAEVLVEAVRNGEDIGSDVVLERYARWRRFDTVSNALAFDAFVRVFSNDNPLMRVVRGAGLAVVNQIAPARRFFMHEAGGGVGDLPKLLRGVSL
jgi:2-octaprenyl-6-methoxyphenol hydroxylase